MELLASAPIAKVAPPLAADRLALLESTAPPGAVRTSVPPGPHGHGRIPGRVGSAAATGFLSPWRWGSLCAGAIAAAGARSAARRVQRRQAGGCRLAGSSSGQRPACSVRCQASATDEFLAFVQKTGSPAHTVAEAKELLQSAGFVELQEGQPWEIKRGGRYYVTQQGTSICAFAVGGQFEPETGGVLIAAAHTDSPCLKLRPVTKVPSKAGTLQLGVDTYGGGLWHTWFDRPLGFAGKVVVAIDVDGQRRIEERLVHIPEPFCIIPNLAIHLTTADERKAFSFNKETQLRPVLCTPCGVGVGPPPSPAPSDGDSSAGTPPEGAAAKHYKELLAAAAEHAGVQPEDILDLDLCLMDASPACVMGDLVSTPRIDNVLSTWAAVDAVASLDDAALESSRDICMAASFDHEEVGSTSATGADSAVLERWLERILRGAPSPSSWEQVASRSFLLSCDCAHGLHPNYADKHQAEHQPILGKGIVIKTNANQRYATTPILAQMVREVGRLSDVPIQEFVVRNDCPCGSTIGPLLSAQLGIRTVDVGAPQWAMHSCRETAHAADVGALRALCRGLFETFRSVDERTSTV